MSPDVTYFPTMASFYFQDAPTFPIVDGSPSMPNMDFQTAVASILYQFQEIGADGSVVNSFMLNATDYSTVSSSGELDTTTGVYSSGQSADDQDYRHHLQHRRHCIGRWHSHHPKEHSDCG